MTIYQLNRGNDIQRLLGDIEKTSVNIRLSIHEQFRARLSDTHDVQSAKQRIIDCVEHEMSKLTKPLINEMLSL